MNYTEAKKYLNRAENNGYVRYHSGLVMTEEPVRRGGNTTGSSWGINIDGDGHNGRLFGCPQMIWDVETAERLFPARKYTKSN
jgi:hypothetical protein